MFMDLFNIIVGLAIFAFVDFMIALTVLIILEIINRKGRKNHGITEECGNPRGKR